MAAGDLVEDLNSHCQAMTLQKMRTTTLLGSLQHLQPYSEVAAFAQAVEDYLFVSDLVHYWLFLALTHSVLEALTQAVAY